MHKTGEGTEGGTASGEWTDVIESPVGGDRIVFLRRAEDTDGEVVEFRIEAAPGAQGPPEHVHDHQEEEFEVLSGTLTGTVDGEGFVLTAGETLTVAAGTPHRWWNADDEPVAVRGEARPALALAEFLETMYGLAADGKTDDRGMPGLLQTAVVADHYRETIRPSRPSPVVQRLALAVLAPVGRLVGHRASYPEYGRAAREAAAANPSE